MDAIVAAAALPTNKHDHPTTTYLHYRRQHWHNFVGGLLLLTHVWSSCSLHQSRKCLDRLQDRCAHCRLIYFADPHYNSKTMINLDALAAGSNISHGRYLPLFLK